MKTVARMTQLECCEEDLAGWQQALESNENLLKIARQSVAHYEREHEWLKFKIRQTEARIALEMPAKSA